MKKTITFFFLFILIHIVAKASADQERYDQTRTTNAVVREDIRITRAIEDAMSSIDQFLAGKRIVDATNHTKITIRNQVNWPEGGPFAYQPHLDLRLHLPNVEKKWQLKFITYDQDQEELGINKSRPKTGPIRNDYAGSIGFFEKLGEVNMQFEPRLEFNGGPQLSYISRLTSTAQTSFLSFHPEMQLFAKSYSGVGEFVGLDTDFPIYKTLFLTLINEEQYLDQANVFSTNNGVGFTFDYNDYMQQQTTYILEFGSRPNFQLSQYIVGSAFTHKLLRNVLHYTIQPYLLFANTNDFVGAPGLNFELDLIF